MRVVNADVVDGGAGVIVVAIVVVLLESVVGAIPNTVFIILRQVAGLFTFVK
jgi:hypothetical protein